MSVTITRKRGDTYPIEASIQINGKPIDLTGSILKFSFKKVGSENITTILGDLDSDVLGLVRFTPTAIQMGEEGQYIYDIQRDTNGLIATHLSGTMLLQGDVTP